MEMPFEEFKKAMMESFVVSFNANKETKEKFRVQRRNLDPKDKKKYDEMSAKMNDDEQALYNKNIETVYKKLGFEEKMFYDYI